jgi:hypothetical protein
MKFGFGFFVVIAAAMVIGCSAKKEESVIGTFEGTLPCADCEGIRTQLKLNQDGSFVLDRVYLKAESLPVEADSGKWTLKDNVVELFPTDGVSGERYCYGVKDANTLQPYDIGCRSMDGPTLNRVEKKS